MDLSTLMKDFAAAAADVATKRKALDEAQAAVSTASNDYQNALIKAQAIKKTVQEGLEAAVPGGDSGRVR